MFRSGWLLLVLACATGAALGAVPRPPVGAVVRGALGGVPIDDPFPIRRVRGTTAQLPGLLKELEPGPVVRLPRAEFEARVRTAGLAVARAKQGARVVEAVYTAELAGDDLTGTAELGILNATDGAGFMPLDPLRLGVRGPKWREGGAAVLAVPAGALAPAVWVAGEGRKTLQFRWSLAGAAEPGERRFELRVPVCASSVLEIVLPNDQSPTAPTDVLLTGPFDAPGKPGQKLWRFRFGGRSRLEFAVRASGAAEVGATAALVAKYELSPNQLAAAFEYELRPARGSVGEWTFLADPGLLVTEVTANNRAGWTVDPPAAPNGPRRVRVRLRQPAPGGKILISAVAPFPDATRPVDAPLPAIRPIGAVTETEAVELRIAAGLKTESWAPGDYHLVNAVTAPDLARVLSLTGTLLPPGSDEPFRRMPTVRAAHRTSEFATFERLEWTPGPESSALVARVRVRAVRGPIFQFLVRQPAGYTLDRGVAVTDELIAHIGAPTGRGQSVELTHPLLTGQQIDLRFEFRAPGVRPGTPVPFPVPDLVGATERAGWLSVSTAPAWAATSQPGVGARPAGLWGWLATDAPVGAGAVYTYNAKEPDGFVTLTPALPDLSADAVVSLGAENGRWVATTRFELNAPGARTSVVVFVPGPHDRSRTWTFADPGNAITGATPVPTAFSEGALFGPIDVCAHVIGLRARASAPGTFWLVRFARPVTGHTVIETVAPGPPLPVAEFALGVPHVVGAAQQSRAELRPTTRRGTVELNGSQLLVRVAPVGAERRVSNAYLLTAVRSADEVVAAFGGTVLDSAGGALPVELPPGAEVRGVCVGGHWLSPAACAARDGAGALGVPLPAGAAVRFEVRYRLGPAPGWPTRRVVSPAPAVPGAPTVARWWSFAAGALPGWPARPWNATAERPPLLGGSLTSGEPALVIRSDEESVWVGSVRVADALAVGAVTLLIAFGIVAAHRGRGGAVLLGCAAAGALVATELGPPWWARVAWPVLGAAVVALARALVLATARRARAVALAALVLGSFRLAAQPPAPATVLVVPAADGGEEVVAPKPLLDRLAALARPAPPAPVIASAVYDVRADDTGARVTARFVAHAFGASDNVLTLPLADTRLEQMTVNGAPAFPTAPRADTYAVALGGPGRYEVEAQFAVSVTATGPERDLKFGTPEVPDSKLTAVLPGAARQPQAARLGRQTAATGGPHAAVGADLGAVRQVHLRWREGGDGAAVVRVREACVWDVTDGGAELCAAYLVRVEQGTVPSLRFDVPAELEVLRVAVRSSESLAAAPPLRDWQLAPAKGGFRALQLAFQGPTTGRFVVVLECAPRKPITRQPVLRFPRVVVGGKGETDAVYALRSTRVAVDEVGRSGTLPAQADALRDFVPIPDLKIDPNNPLRMFRPAPGAVAELRPVIHAEGLPVVHTSTAWTVGPTRADAIGTLSWTADAPVALVEFTVPGTKLLEVRGPGVFGWNQAGGRVQVWLRAGAKAGAVEWHGSLGFGGKPGNELLFEPGSPVVAHARLESAEVRVRPIGGWSVRADRARGWHAAPTPAGELLLRTDGPPAQRLRVCLTPNSATR